MDIKEFCSRYYTDRMGTSSLKWDALAERFGDPDLIAMWVADMEFKSPECVLTALHNRVDHGVFGYSFVPDSYYQAVIDWESTHHGYQLKKEWIRVSPGVVAALYWSVNMYTQKDDSIIVLTPVYYPFLNAIKDSSRNLITCDLIYNKGVYTIDFDAFEKQIIEHDVKMYILCSPHNPVGRVWTETELETMLDICARHNVLVLSDEIHQDLVFGERKHIPAATIANGKYAQNIITAFASSKTFNLASCLTSTVVIENEDLRKTWDAFTAIYHNVDTNIFGITAVEAALRGGEEWYQALKKLIRHNYELAVTEMQEFPDIYISPLEGTYLMFMDLRNYVDPAQTKEFIQNQCKIAVDYGEWFGAGWEGFIRLNLGTTPEIMAKTIDRIKTNLRNL